MVNGRIPTLRAIKQWLSSKLGYVYKKGSSRSILSNNPKLKYLQAIFSWRILDFLKEDYYVINVDECSFSKLLKQNYCWLPKGEGAPIINIKCKGSANAIFALGWDGEWIWTLYDGSTKSERFSQFLMLIKNYALLVLDRTTEEIKITMDNAVIHVSEKTKSSASYLKLEIHWLSQYSPTLATVELVFGITKRKLASTNSKKWIDFNKIAGKKTIANWIWQLDNKTGARLWSRFIRASRSIILRWLILLSHYKFEKSE